MKIFKIWPKAYLFPLCLFLAFWVLTSCQEQEIIPINETDLTEISADALLSSEEATHFLINTKGKPIAYTDPKTSNLYSLDGSTTTKKEVLSKMGNTAERTNFLNFTIQFNLFLYDQPDFKNVLFSNVVLSTLAGATSYEVDLVGPLAHLNGDLGGSIQSLVIPANHKITFYNSNGGFTIFPPESYPKYLNSPGGGNGYNWVTRIKVEINTTAVNHCGYAYDNSFNVLPIFKDYELNFYSGPQISSFSYWYNKITGYVRTHGNDCPGVIFYDHQTDVNQGHVWSGERTNGHITNFATHLGTSQGDGRPTRILSSPEKIHAIAEADFDSGAVLYEGFNFTGTPHVYIENAPNQKLTYDIGSVVAINTDVRVGSIMYKRGTYTKLLTKTGEGLQFELTNKRVGNQLCGVAYTDKDHRQLPIVNYHNGPIPVNTYSGYNNEITRFAPTTRTTACKGVIFWNKSGVDRLKDARQWFPIEQCNGTCPAINFGPSAITTGVAPLFSHPPTSGVFLTKDNTKGIYLLGRFSTDMQYILSELTYPIVEGNGPPSYSFDCNFPLPNEQDVNILNSSMEIFDYYHSSNGFAGFFREVNIPWVVSAVTKGQDFFFVSKAEGNIYWEQGPSQGELTGFGKEVYYLEERYNFRYNPNTNIIGNGNSAFPRLTRSSDLNLTHAQLNYMCPTN